MEETMNLNRLTKTRDKLVNFVSEFKKLLGRSERLQLLVGITYKSKANIFLLLVKFICLITGLKIQMN